MHLRNKANDQKRRYLVRRRDQDNSQTDPEREMEVGRHQEQQKEKEDKKESFEGSVLFISASRKQTPQGIEPKPFSPRYPWVKKKTTLRK